MCSVLPVRCSSLSAVAAHTADTGMTGLRLLNTLCTRKAGTKHPLNSVSSLRLYQAACSPERSSQILAWRDLPRRRHQNVKLVCAALVGWTEQLSLHALRELLQPSWQGPGPPARRTTLTALDSVSRTTRRTTLQPCLASSPPGNCWFRKLSSLSSACFQMMWSFDDLAGSSSATHASLASLTSANSLFSIS